jgi:hypothetical protein
LKSLKKQLLAIPSQEVDPEEMQREFPGSGFHFTSHASGIFIHQATEKVSFTFFPPEDISLIGSYQLKVQSKSTLNVDIAIVLPRRTWKARDIHSHLYFDKRALYLGVVAKSLQGNEALQSVELSAFRGDLQKPVLSVRPFVNLAKTQEKKLSRFVVNIYPVIDQLQFPPQKLLLTKGYVISDDWECKSGREEEGGAHPGGGHDGGRGMQGQKQGPKFLGT